jgi:hypothetical protein
MRPSGQPSMKPCTQSQSRSESPLIVCAARPLQPARTRGVVRESGAAQQRDAADEGRLEVSGSAMVGEIIVNQGKVVRPSQLIASVGQLLEA